MIEFRGRLGGSGWYMLTVKCAEVFHIHAANSSRQATNDRGTVVEEGVHMRATWPTRPHKYEDAVENGKII